MKAEVHGVGEHQKAFDGSVADDWLAKIWRQSVESADRKLFINGDNAKDAVTTTKFYIHASSIAAYIQSREFAQRDVACILSKNSWEYAAAFIGITALGGVVASVNTGSSADEVTEQLNRLGPKVVFADASRVATAHLSARNVAALHKPLVVRLASRPVDEADSLPKGVIELSKVLMHEPRFVPPATLIDPIKDVLMLATTSGVTGHPKQVMITHANVSTMLANYHMHDVNCIHPKLAQNYDATKETICIFQPSDHVSWVLLPLHFAAQGTQVIIMDGFKQETLLPHIQDYKIKRLYISAVDIRRLIDAANGDYDLSSLKLLHCNAAIVSTALLAEAQKKLKVDITRDYGQTETTWIITRGKPEDPTTASGRLLGRHEAKVVDVETRKTLLRGQPGELLVRGPQLMAGYLTADKSNHGVIDSDGWLKTNDLASIDDDDSLHIIDRLADCFHVDDQLVAPAELDDILLTHEGVADAACIGVADERHGAAVKAFVVRRDESLVPSQLHEFFNAHPKIAHHSHKQLHGGIEFIDSLPRTFNGKILRRRLHATSDIN